MFKKFNVQSLKTTLRKKNHFENKDNVMIKKNIYFADILELQNAYSCVLNYCVIGGRKKERTILE